ncbi:MAG TPA: carbohydrate ABC transporter permease [Vicinamibacteria bacterium]
MKPPTTTVLVRGAASVLVGAVALVFVFPFAWMLLASFKSNPEIFRPFPLIPGAFPLDHYRALFDGSLLPFPRQFANSLIVASVQTALMLALAVPAGYAFAQHRFAGRRALLGLALGTVVLPAPALALPLFAWMHRLGLYDTLPAAILPGIASGLAVIFFTMVFRRVPRELVDLARGEGASEGRVLRTLLPLVSPAVLTFGLIHFVLAWQEHLIPLVMLGSAANKTLPVALASLYGSTLRYPYAALMAACFLTTLPTAAAYVLLRRQFRSALRELVR